MPQPQATPSQPGRRRTLAPLSMSEKPANLVARVALLEDRVADLIDRQQRLDAKIATHLQELENAIARHEITLARLEAVATDHDGPNGTQGERVDDVLTKLTEVTL